MLNRAVLMGRICADPELKQTGTGISVCSFTIAVNRSFQSKSGERETDFIDIVCWRQSAEFVCKYFAKGSMIAVDGRIQTRSYEDSQGNKRKAFEIVADNVNFCGDKSSGGNSGVSGNTQTVNFEEPQKGSGFSIGDFGEFEEVDTDDSELPF